MSDIVERLRFDVGSRPGGICDEAADEIKRLRAEVAALKKDAERYRHLRDQQHEDGFVVTWQSEDVAYGVQLDRRVDAALSGKEAG